MAKAKKSTVKKSAAVKAPKVATKRPVGVPKKVGVISTIIEMISRDKGASKEEMLKVLTDKFPDRDPAGMSKTITIQANRHKSSKETDEKRGLVFL